MHYLTRRFVLATLTVAIFLCAVAASTSRAFAADGAAISIRYTLAKASAVSINVYDAQGHVVRELLHGAKRPAGAGVETWNALDEAGNPVPAGAYTWKMLATQGLHSHYVMTIGTSTIPSYDLWPGNHGATMSVAADATGIYVGTGCGEATPSLMKLGYDGKEIWTIPTWVEAWMGFLSIAPDGPNVYLFSGDKIFVYDSATGKPVTGPWTSPQIAHAARIAARGDQLVVLCPADKELLWLDQKTGAVVDTAPMPDGNLEDVKIGADGAILVIVDGAVESLTRANKALKPLIDKSQLDSPVRLAVDDSTGDIIVAENSHPVFDNSAPDYDTPPASGNQVKRFTAAGQRVKVYGKPGGRKWQGAYDTTGFAGIYDVCADSHGGFIVTEPAVAPRRIADYGGDGALVREWYGGQMYANFAYADPEDPTLVWSDTQWGELMQTKVDYAAKTWKVLATYEFGGLADGLISGTYHGGGRWRVRHNDDGQTYLARANAMQIVRVDAKSGRLVPCLVCMPNLDHDWSIVSKASPLIAKLRTDPSTQHSAIWFDFNGDGRIQPNEIRFYPDTDKLDADLLADPFTGDPNAAADKKRLVAFYRWAAAGPPYNDDIDAAAKREPGPSFPGADNRADVMTALADDGSYFTAYNTDSNKIFGQGWWGAHVGGNRVFKWDKSGKFDWVVGEHAAGITAQPGESKYFWGVPGTTHGCIVVEEAEGPAGAHVWDTDGLWVGNMLDDPDLSAVPAGAYQLCFENFGDSLYTNPKTGNVLFFGGTQNATNVYRVTGWDDFVRSSGSLSVSAEQASAAAERTRAIETSSGVAHIVFTAADIKLDGDMSQFKDAKPIKIMDGPNVLATVSLLWNQHGLYAAYQVTTDEPWKSSASDPQLAFEGGAAVDVDFGPLQPDRSSPVAGDQRVVAAPSAGGNMIVEYLPQLAAGMSPNDLHPATYQTGQGRVVFQYVQPQNPAWVHEQVVSTDGTDPEADKTAAPTGYIVMMQIPVRDPVLLRPGAQMRFDASVTLSNPQGTHTLARVPWHSTDPLDKMTQDTYLESLLRPQNWGIAVLE